MRKYVHFFLTLFTIVSASAADKPRLELHDGDRIVFIGGVFMEREQEEGFIETMLTLSFPEKNLSFRNLGWGGDTVESHLHPVVPARPTYVPKLFDYVEKLKPTVIFVSYGMMESFRGEAGLADFEKNYHELLDKLSQHTKRIVLISPFKHERLGGHFPDPAGHNQNLGMYVEAIEKIARKRNLFYVNLFETLLVAPTAEERMTINGVHLNTRGYQSAALAIQKELGLSRFVSFPKKDFQLGEKIRPAIKHKNLQWWYHYRPMNSEYVYPGGTRYQDDLGGVKHPMFEEIELFAYMAEVEEKGIHVLRERVFKGGSQRTVVDNKTKTVPSTNQQRMAPDPEKERKTFQVAEGLEVSLFAADPLINKPVQIAFDAKGRLWVATTTLYPQIKPGEEPTDKIIILEDKDRDGRADKTTVFADGLYIPTGILPTSDGVYVSDDTKIYYFRDRDGDGRADEKEVILSGFGTEDSHHKAHVFRWDPHGAFHFNVGVFLHNNIETAHGLVSQSGHWNAGVLAYRPDTGELKVHLANSVPPNPWGHYWNYWGFDFLIDSSGQLGSNFILPTANRTSSAISVPGGNGKLSGGELISSRHFPEDWQGNLIAAPFKENRLGRWEFSDDSSGYSEKAMKSVIVSTDSAFRPVDHRIGPDGALYVADWYNPLIGHMQHHFRDPGRDFTHGRIWRITAKGRPLVFPAKIENVSLGQLFENLKSPEADTRLHSRRELAERRADQVAFALRNWVKKLDSSDPKYDHHRLEALWTFQNIQVVELELLRSLLVAKDPNPRAAAAVVLRHWRDEVKDGLELLEKLVVDDHPRVRLQAVIALSYFTDKRAMEIATRVLDKSMDNYLEQALKNTAAALKPYWEPTVAAGETLFKDAKKSEFVLQAAGIQANPKALLSLLKLGKVSPENFDLAINTLAQKGDKGELGTLFRMDFPNEQRVKVLAGLARAARERSITLTVNTESGKRLENWLGHSDEMVKAEAIQLVGAWKGELFRGRFTEIAKDEKASDRIRIAAMNALAALGGESSKKILYELSVPNASPVTRNAAIAALASIDLGNAASHVADILYTEQNADEVFALLKIILSREGGAGHLGSILETNPAQQKLTTDNAKVGLRFMQMNGKTSGFDNERLIKMFSAAAGTNVEAQEWTREELAKFAADAQAKGDPTRGEQIFRRQDTLCFQCHAIGGAGGILGPELGAVGSGSQVDYLIESLLNPNKIIKDGFETWEITTTDDETTVGIKVRENPQEIVLKDAARNEIVIPTSSIKKKENKKTSLMPAGLTAALTRGESLDLVRFLSELGKPGPYANNPSPIARRWQVASVDAKSFKADSIAWTEALSWTAAYSMVSGILPLDALSQDGVSSSKIALARCQVEITTPGKIRFRINGTDSLNLWVDGKATELKQATLLDLPRGVHDFVFAVDLTKRKDGLLVEFEQVADSPGRFQMVMGK